MITINICVANSTWPVTVTERKVRTRCVNELGGSHVMVSIALIGVVRLFYDGAALAEIMDGDPD